jgi:hypothetical protein
MSAMPQYRPNSAAQRNGAMGQFRTHAPQQKTSLFDHVVGAGKHGLRNGNAKRFGGLEVDAISSNFVGFSTSKLPGFAMDNFCVLRAGHRT